VNGSGPPGLGLYAPFLAGDSLDVTPDQLSHLPSGSLLHGGRRPVEGRERRGFLGDIAPRGIIGLPYRHHQEWQEDGVHGAYGV